MLYFLVFVAIFMLDANSASAADSNIHYDGRAIRDVAEFNLGEVLEASDKVWVLAEVKPSPTSGQMRAEGAYIKGESGELVLPQSARFVMVVEGSVDLVTALARTPTKNRWDYKWEWQLRSRDPEQRATYSPFRSGGFAILRVDERTEGATKFQQVSVIPPEWTQFMMSAIEYYRKNGALFREEDLEDRGVSQLQELLVHENPFLAGAAYRRLARAGVLDRALITDHLMASRSLRQALFTVLVVRHVPQETRQALVEGIVKSATGLDQIAGIALGGFVVLSEGTGAPSRDLGLRILGAVRDKTRVLNSDDAAYRYISSILAASGLP